MLNSVKLTYEVTAGYTVFKMRIELVKVGTHHFCHSQQNELIQRVERLAICSTSQVALEVSAAGYELQRKARLLCNNGTETEKIIMGTVSSATWAGFMTS